MAYTIIPFHCYKKSPEIIILHIRTNNTLNDSSKVVLGKLLDPKQIIEKTLPESNFVISNLITLTDNDKASLIVIKTSDHLQVSRLDVVDNGNTRFLFYKQHFYKQHQAEIGKKKLSKI